MDQFATGGNAFSHKSKDGKNSQKTIQRFTIKEAWEDMGVYFILVFVLFWALGILLSFGLAQLFYVSTPLWDFLPDQGFENPHGGYEKTNAPLQSFILPGFLIGVCGMASSILALSKFWKKQLFLGLLSITLGIIIAISHPASSRHPDSINLEAWAQDRYGVELVDKHFLSDLSDSGSGIDYRYFARDDQGNTIFAIKDPNRDDQIFLYEEDGKTELPLKESK